MMVPKIKIIVLLTLLVIKSQNSRDDYKWFPKLITDESGRFLLQTYSFGSSPFNKKPARESTVGPTRIHKMIASNCSDIIVRGFLKHRCLINNRWYFKCRKSNRFYKVIKEGGKETTFSKVCPNDPSFYQTCGHNPYKRAKNNNWEDDPKIAVCGEYVCQPPSRNCSKYDRLCNILE